MWQRLPAYFPNFPLRMLPLAPEAFKQLRETGWLREVAFRTQPRVNKLEIKQFLQSVYGLEVERVNTLNYQGKKKAQFDTKGKVHYYRLSDWKKAYVIFKPPPDVLEKLTPRQLRAMDTQASREQLLQLQAQLQQERKERKEQWHQRRQQEQLEREERRQRREQKLQQQRGERQQQQQQQLEHNDNWQQGPQLREHELQQEHEKKYQQRLERREQKQRQHEAGQEQLGGTVPRAATPAETSTSS